MTDAAATFVVCSVGAARLGLPVAEVVEVVPVARLVDVPSASPWLLGLLHLRGASLTVVDTAVRLGLDACPPGLDARIVVVGRGSRRVGLLVENDVTLLTVAVDQVRAPSSVEARGGAVQAVVEAASGPVVVVDVDVFLNDEVAA